ncbi:MAG: hypothetical protein HUU20_16840 [Pirellulales bacterium]|nr:hypothetical protein [Pirellulales bacterium]
MPRPADGPPPSQAALIKTSCPRCDAKIQIAPSLVGRQIACNSCQTRLLVLLVVSEVEPSALSGAESSPQGRQAVQQTPGTATAVKGSGPSTQPALDHRKQANNRPASESAVQIPSRQEQRPAAAQVAGGRTAVPVQSEAAAGSAEAAEASAPARRMAPWVLPLVLAGALGSIAIAGFAVVFGDLLGSGRSPIGGMVVGAEQQSGKVTFSPLGPPERPSAVTTFRNGQYQFNRANGPCAGLHRVSVKFDQQTAGPAELSVPVIVPEESPWQVDIKLR